MAYKVVRFEVVTMGIVENTVTIQLNIYGLLSMLIVIKTETALKDEVVKKSLLN
jgi:hypothetical protein